MILSINIIKYKSASKYKSGIKFEFGVEVEIVFENSYWAKLSLFF